VAAVSLPEVYFVGADEAALDGDGYLHQRDGDSAFSRCRVPWVELEPVSAVPSPALCLGCWDLDEFRRQGVPLRWVPVAPTSWPGGGR
jgi:hypothetical protein